MSIYSVKAFVAMVLAFCPMTYISLGVYAMPIMAVSWYCAYRLAKDLIRLAEKDERRSAGQAERRSKGCVEKTRSHYSR